MLSKIDTNKFNTLIETNALINSNYSDPNLLLNHILDSATRLCGGESSSLLLVNRETRELQFAIISGEAEAKHFTVKMGEGVAGWVALHNKSIIVDDSGENKKSAGEASAEGVNQAKTILAAPIRVKEECLGVIEITKKKGGKKFNQDDLEWLEIFATQAGIALVNARGIEEARNKIAQLLHEKTRLNTWHNTIIAKSDVILEKLKMLEKIAGTDSSVLILGESGVGKGVFAEQIHLKSRRSKMPFVRLHCPSIPENLLESELFGTVRDNSADAVKHGRFELADGGTIFLDGIDELPDALQVRLLRFIGEGTYEKAGSSLSVALDVRILAATCADIEKLVESGKFRSDLYYRLNVLPLYIPPLRQRPEDIRGLAEFFLKDFNSKMKIGFEGFSREAMETMLSYPWPGNIRELKNCIERACVTGKGRLIEAEDLFLKTGYSPVYSGGENRNLKNAENIFRVAYIRQILEKNKWNQTETSKDLGIQRTYLSRLIKELEIKNSKEQRNG